MTPDLIDTFAQHVRRLSAGGYETAADAYAFPNSRGNRSARQRIAAVVGDAAQLAAGRLEQHGLPLLPAVTPHTLPGPISRSHCSRTASTSSG